MSLKCVYSFPRPLLPPGPGSHYLIPEVLWPVFAISLPIVFLSPTIKSYGQKAPWSELVQSPSNSCITSPVSLTVPLT